MATIRGRAGLAQTSGGKWSGDCTLEVTGTTDDNKDTVQGLINEVQSKLPDMQDFIDAEVKRRNGG